MGGVRDAPCEQLRRLRCLDHQRDRLDGKRITTASTTVSADRSRRIRLALKPNASGTTPSGDPHASGDIVLTLTRGNKQPGNADGDNKGGAGAGTTQTLLLRVKELPTDGSSASGTSVGQAKRDHKRIVHLHNLLVANLITMLVAQCCWPRSQFRLRKSPS
ncbi:hypothetical protein PF008_g23701 [Phytophthora fragariae]|uniref:Uncharacterized protein n=1 Tax=Phytophthora fragariae TaxID=53985 RepID=A0A6G0QPZ0_9STRA|nr:hypothetical protein PF008_g23701 [Phytophthora fragariae]